MDSLREKEVAASMERVAFSLSLSPRVCFWSCSFSERVGDE